MTTTARIIEVRGTIGAPWRAPLEKAALVVIDMQRDFLDPRGAFGTAGLDTSPLRAIVPTVRRVIAAARAAGMLVVHTREGHEPGLSDLTEAKQQRSRSCGCEIGERGPLGRFLVRGEPGHAIIAELAPRVGEPVIDKPGFGAFYRTDLQALLHEREITHLVLTGVTTECCVQSTLREAVDRGFCCLTLEDACAAYDRAQHDAALALVRHNTEAQLFGWCATADEFTAALT